VLLKYPYEYNLCPLSYTGSVVYAIDRNDLIDNFLMRAKLVCHYICDDTLKNSGTLFKKDNGKILFKKILKYPIDIYSQQNQPFSANYLCSLENINCECMSYSPNTGLLYDSLHNNEHFSYLDNATSEDIPTLLSSGMLSYKEGAQLLDLYNLPPIKNMEILDI
jgi:hypothetical protein